MISILHDIIQFTEEQLMFGHSFCYIIVMHTMHTFIDVGVI